MQTFLPYPDFHRSAQSLDRQRLGKQRVECLQMLRALQTGSGGWANHVCTKMWAGYETALKCYSNAIIKQWVQRGYKNTMEVYFIPAEFEMPWWFGDERLHASHRAALLHKLPEWYGQFGWVEEPKLEYWWPRKDE